MACLRHCGIDSDLCAGTCTEMEFPLDVWRLIKSYQIPYRAYWSSKLDASIALFNPYPTLPLAAPRAPCLRLWGRVRFSADPRWPSPVTVMASIAAGLPSRYIVYRHGIIHYPAGAGGRCLAPAETFCITNYR